MVFCLLLIIGTHCEPKPYYDGQVCLGPAYPNTTIAQLCAVRSFLEPEKYTIEGPSQNLLLFCCCFFFGFEGDKLLRLLLINAAVIINHNLVLQMAVLIMEMFPGMEVLNISGNNFAFSTHICDENGNWTNSNFDLCTKHKEDLVHTPAFVFIGRQVIVVLSVMSLIALGISLFIFFYFKSLYCCRLRAHRNFCTALIFNLIFLTIWTILSEHFGSFTQIEWLCKSCLSLYLYFCMASVFWMYVEGFILHRRVTTHIFLNSGSFKLYYIIGWGIPMICTVTWAVLMQKFDKTEQTCWLTYLENPFLGLIILPILLALLINLAFFINIIRVLLKKRNNLTESTALETNQNRNALKAAVLLFPLLGIPYLANMYKPNPGTVFSVIHFFVEIFLKSSQGLFFSIIYCFMNDDVQTAVKKAFNRYTARRNIRSGWKGVSLTSQTFLSESGVPTRRIVNSDLTNKRRSSTPLPTNAVIVTPDLQNCDNKSKKQPTVV